MAVLIGVVSQKGGVGKSMISRLLATEYARVSWNVLIADMDSSQSTSYEWNLRRQKNKINPFIHVERFIDVEDAIQVHESYDLIVATNGLICWIAKWLMSTLSFCFVNGRSACLLYIALLATILFLQHKHLIYPIIISVCTLLYAVDRIQLIVAKQKKCKMICYNNDQLSFTLKDGIEHLHCDDPPSNKIRHYAKGIIATWYKKVILTIDTIPSDWYGWRGAKLDADYLLIDEKLLPDIAIILKVCNLKTLVVYSKKAHPLGYNLNTKKLGIKLIWLKPGSKKTLTWSKNL